MTVVVLVIFVIVAGMAIFFRRSSSKLHNDFLKEANEAAIKEADTQSVLGEADIESLPEAVKRFYRYAGYIGKKQSGHVRLFCKEADFSRNQGDQFMTIDYTEEVFSKVTRLAFIDTKMFGIPFQGLDRCIEGRGSMTGVLAKLIQLFCVTGREMDEAALATWLCEAVLLPQAMIGKNIQWQEHNENSATATVTAMGMTVSATYLFDEKGRLLSAQTDNRWLTEKDGSFTKLTWLLVFEDYKDKDSRRLPQSVKAIWYQDKEDYTYFRSKKAEMRFF